MTMFLLRMLFRLGVICCCVRTCSSRFRTKALFPAAGRVRRDLTAGGDRNFCSSSSDARLLYEILLTGVHFDPNGTFTVADEELTSLRKTRDLDVICEEIIPRQLTDILRLVSELSRQENHLHQDDFERTLMTLVYTTQQMVNSTQQHQREAWAQSFVGLYKALKRDLTMTN